MQEVLTTPSRKRCKSLTADDAAKLKGMSEPSDMPREQRKRNYAQLGRMIRLDADLASRFKILGSDKDKFQFMRDTLLSAHESSVAVVSKILVSKQTENKDRYRTVSKLQLQKMYGDSDDAKEFIRRLLKGQVGKDHPQAPGFSPAKLYRVLKDSLEDHGSKHSMDTSVEVGGEVDTPEAREALVPDMEAISVA